MKIEVNITKNRFFVLIASIFFITAGIFVYAYNSDWQVNPSNTSVLMGHTVDEIEGLDDYIRQIVDQEISGLSDDSYTCDTVPALTSNFSGGLKEQAVTLPAGCFTSSNQPFCVIKQEIYNSLYSNLSAPPTLVRLIQFSQDDSATGQNVWWSSYYASGSKDGGSSTSTNYINGNSIYTDIAPKYSVSMIFYGTGSIRILDDSTSGSVDRGSAGAKKITLYDDLKYVRSKIYFCTFTQAA